MSATAGRTFPLSPGGAAEGCVPPVGSVELVDLTATPRFGLKGPGSAAWLAVQGLVLPDVNRVADLPRARLLRLGGEDFLVAGEGCEALAGLWHAAEGPKGYWSWREEGWAWMRLAGPLAGEAMARLCAVDLRDGKAAADAVVQTRVAQLDAVVVRDGRAFDLFFDIASTAFLVRAVRHAAERAAHAAGPRETEGRS
ncbi:MAG: hypothetical protein U1E62_03715 [Alsobacter sp.]